MTAHRTGRPAPGRPLKSPLAIHGEAITSFDFPDRRPAALPNNRSTTIAEFDEYLRIKTNREGRPYEDATIEHMSAPPSTWTGG